MLPLHDDYKAVIAKAQYGAALSNRQLAKKADISINALNSLLSGVLDEGNLLKVAQVLGLGGNALLRLARNASYPQIEVPQKGLHIFIDRYGQKTVNSYLIWDPQTADGFIFDAGCEVGMVNQALKRNNVSVRAIFLTHSHADHAGRLLELKNAINAPVYISDFEPILDADVFAPLQDWQVGPVVVGSRHLPGHSSGSSIFRINGLERPMVVVGDVLCAGSVGWGHISHQQNLEGIRREIFSLSDDTILMPGHGPLTTVGEEKKNNPFFPDLNA